MFALYYVKYRYNKIIRAARIVAEREREKNENAKYLRSMGNSLDDYFRYNGREGEPSFIQQRKRRYVRIGKILFIGTSVGKYATCPAVSMAMSDAGNFRRRGNLRLFGYTALIFSN